MSCEKVFQTNLKTSNEMSTPDVQLEPSVNKRPLFKQWLLQGAITGIGSGFLFVLLEILLWRNPYHYLLIAALPICLAWGLVMGAFQSLILWLITKLIRR